jgi:hypothetical protein
MNASSSAKHMKMVIVMLQCSTYNVGRFAQRQNVYKKQPLANVRSKMAEEEEGCASSTTLSADWLTGNGGSVGRGGFLPHPVIIDHTTRSINLLCWSPTNNVRKS